MPVPRSRLTDIRAILWCRTLRKFPSIVAFLLLGWAIYFALVGRHDRAIPKLGSVSSVPAQNIATSPRADADQSALRTTLAPAPPPASHFPEKTMRQTVFRLQLDGSRCSLENIAEVTGSFGRQRAMPWQAGMLCCRLLAGDGRIVGEQTIPAPDYVCVVLDPNDASGAPAAARLTSDGPAVFQVRFPEISGAERLEVYRIATEARPGDAAAPIGQLLGSITIPVK